jgi:hypothetical protein
MFEKSREDGDALDKLDEYTEVIDGQRSMVYGELEEPTGNVIADEVREVTAAERRMVTAALADYRGSLADPSVMSGDALRVKGISRRLGAGVSSYASLRFYALLEGPTAAVDDDVLIELKETGDALRFPNHPVFTRSFADNGARAVTLQRAFQGRDDADVFLGRGAAGDLVFRIRHRTGYQRNIGIDKIAEEIVEQDWTADDYVALGELAGRLLARCHALSETAAGEPGLGPIAAAIGGDFDGLIAETEAHVADYGPVIAADHQRLIELLEIRGALLGYRP